MKFDWYVVARPKDFQLDEWVVIAGFTKDTMARLYREHVATTQKKYDFRVVDADKFDSEYISLKED
jgi:hypothetical protein